MINAIVLGSGLIVFVAIVLKIQNIKLVERRSLASEDAAEVD